ncbi:hypothetical protein D3C74_376060 [compost metagenome]
MKVHWKMHSSTGFHEEVTREQIRTMGLLKKYIEIGIGNTWFIRTEMEQEDGTETEIKGIVRPFKLKSVYLRLWIRRIVLILDLREGVKVQTKSKNNFKIVLGFYGENWERERAQ